MPIYAIIEDGSVTNMVLWDGNTDEDGWTPPEGSTAISLQDTDPYGIGWTYDGTTWTAPPVTPPVVVDTPPVDPVTKLTAFLQANPDVAALVGA